MTGITILQPQPSAPQPGKTAVFSVDHVGACVAQQRIVSGAAQDVVGAFASGCEVVAVPAHAICVVRPRDADVIAAAANAAVAR